MALGVLALSACGNKDNPNEGQEPVNILDLLYANGKEVRDQEIRSTAMQQTMKYNVWLPPKYNKDTSYPILYLLHGAGDDHNAWLSNTINAYGGQQGGDAAQIAANYVKANGVPMIIVMPDAQLSFYMGNFETYMYQELMPTVEKDYKFNGKRAVAGLSMGGYGTLYYALKYPQMFTYAYAMSPAVSTEMADMVTDPKILPGMTVETGEADITTQMATITPFVEAMRAKGVNIDYITVPNYGHQWEFWRACLPHALQKIGESFK
jgi:S-formylglutathione hydrolase FrmB